MSIQTKPSIVFAHGIWVDGSSFSKVIRPLLADRYEVIAAQYGLHSLKSDVPPSLPRSRRRKGIPALHPGGAMNIAPGDLSVQVTTDQDGTLWVELRGEADIATHDHLRATLAQIPLDGKGAVHLGLCELTFCDTRAFCHLVSFAARVQQRGRRLATDGASGIIRKMSALLDTHGRLNLA